MRHVLLPLDGSAFGETALPIAIAVADRKGMQLELVTVHGSSAHPDISAAMTAEIEASCRVQARAYLEGLAEQVRRRLDVEVRATVLDGEVEAALAGHAKADPPELIVMSTHGRAGPSRLFLGSVTDRLIRELHCPFLLVHPTPSFVPRELPAAARVLVPLDGSALAESVLDEVAQLFPAGMATLHLVRVVAPTEVIPAGAPMALPIVMPELMETRLASAREYLEGTASKLRAASWHAEHEVITEWTPATAVLSYAEAHECEAIAIATRGLGGVQRMLLGSVADKVIRGAATPILVVNPPAGAFSRVLDRAEDASQAQGSEGVLHGAGRAS
jgi:nucleotide-binding universal stress UspA family protein